LVNANRTESLRILQIIYSVILYGLDDRSSGSIRAIIKNDTARIAISF
jgi:hypothetical protein